MKRTIGFVLLLISSVGLTAGFAGVGGPLSNTECPIVVAAALKKAEQVTGAKKWTTANQKQQTFLSSMYPEMTNQIVGMPEIKTTAGSPADVNTFLRSQGFSIRLDEKLDFGTAGVMSLKMKWLEKGTVTTVEVQGNHFPAFKLLTVTFYHVPVRNGLVLGLRTTTTDIVYLAPVFEDEYALPTHQLVQRLSREKKQYQGSYWQGAIIPMVDLIDNPDLSWMVGLSATDRNGGPVVINQALQETKFKMDELGASAESGAAAGGTRADPKEHETFVIDRPFVAWIERPQVGIVFAARCSYNCWRDPKAPTK
jgi:hypothetical protein